MKRWLAFWLLFPLAAAAAVPAGAPPASSGPAATQAEVAALKQQMDALTRRMADLSAKLGDNSSATVLRYLADGKRALLGIAVAQDAHSERVLAVTPGGPAARAGIKVGDLITAIAGTPVSASTSGGSAGLADFEPGKAVTLTVERGSRTLHLTVTPERLAAGSIPALLGAVVQQAAEIPMSPGFGQSPDVTVLRTLSDGSVLPDLGKELDQEGVKAPIALALRKIGAPWWGLDLAPLNPDLGRYFGASNGVLVLSRDAKSFPALQPGDVITRVDGRAVTTPADAMRALRAAPSGKAIPIAILRHRKALRLSLTAPSAGAIIPPLPPVQLHLNVAKPFRVM